VIRMMEMKVACLLSVVTAEVVHHGMRDLRRVTPPPLFTLHMWMDI
jgi:hypothetical protein